MKRVIIAGAALLTLIGASAAVSLTGSTKPVKATVNSDQIQPTAQVITQPAPVVATAQTPVTAAPVAQSVTPAANPSPTQPTTQSQSGTGNGSFTFTPTSNNWTVDYTFSGCDENGFTLLTKTGGRNEPSTSGSGSLSGVGTNPVTIRVAGADTCQWSLTVQ